MSHTDVKKILHCITIIIGLAMYSSAPMKASVGLFSGRMYVASNSKYINPNIKGSEKKRYETIICECTSNCTMEITAVRGIKNWPGLLVPNEDK